MFQKKAGDKSSTTMGQFGKYFDFVPGEKSTRFIDVIKKIKPLESQAFEQAANPESNINTKNKRHKTDLPASMRRQIDSEVHSEASKILSKVAQKKQPGTYAEPKLFSYRDHNSRDEPEK